MPLHRDAYVLASERDKVRTAAEMVPFLIAAPKPLICRAYAAAGAVSVRWDPPREGTIAWLTYVATVRPRELDTDSSQSLRVSMRKVIESAGALVGHAEVLCAARDETLLLPVAAVERWEQEYAIVLGGYALDAVDNPWTTDWPAYREARARGAACLLRFGALQRWGS